ncbi:max dimerization protein 3 isoform X2 [Heptranchias perlo]|uniref:max dimerization protein 3 isoform X2 n=1 Tax=Heptranchias perlo TaxID=212740 RepID=UPI00355A3024
MNTVQLINIERLIEAAQYLDRREREAEHGYASLLPCRSEEAGSKRKSKSKKGAGNRSTHNEMEKNRCWLLLGYHCVGAFVRQSVSAYTSSNVHQVVMKSRRSWLSVGVKLVQRPYVVKGLFQHIIRNYPAQIARFQVQHLHRGRVKVNSCLPGRLPQGNLEPTESNDTGHLPASISFS